MARSIVAKTDRKRTAALTPKDESLTEKILKSAYGSDIEAMMELRHVLDHGTRKDSARAERIVHQMYLNVETYRPPNRQERMLNAELIGAIAGTIMVVAPQLEAAVTRIVLQHTRKRGGGKGKARRTA
jgi:hypothetical protein